MATTAVSQPSMMEVDKQPVNDNPAPASEDSKPIVGIIYPPPNIRETVDTAAAFLANKPPQLEDRIRENERHNPKFCFLNPSDPYHAYYQFKLQEAREGKTTKKPGKEDKVEQQQPKEQGPPKQPEAFEFSAQMPAMSAQDLDIMKLTAQFAARNGRNFINQLSQRESRNYQFDFLRPSHSLFPFFTELVKQYTKVLVPPKDMKQKLKANAETKYRILDRVKERVEWVAWVEAEKKKKEDEDEKERLAYASIDWHDFIIVETIDFTEADDQMDIPPPMSLSELENMSLAQKRMNAMAEQPQEEDKPADMEMDIEDVDMEEESDKEEEEVPSQPAEIPKIPDSNVPVKVRTDYKPKLLGVTPQKANEPTQVCPRCGVAFPISEMDEHMRVELLDPKWKEQKLAMEAKMKDSNLLQEGTDVAKILKNFAGYRSDMFGEEETSIGKKIDEAEEEAKKKERVTWDGHTATINLATQRAQQSTSIEEQIAAIHRSKGFTPETYGPRIPEAAPIEQPPQSQPQQQQPQPPYGSPAAPQAYYSAPPQATPIPRPDPSGAFNNQLPNMYMQQPPLPAMGIPPPLIGTNIRKAEDNLDQTELKRARFENGQPAEGSEWTQQPTELSIKISTPNMPDKPEWNLTGNTIVLSGLAPGTLVSTVKDRISSQLGMPAGKQKLTTSGTSVVLNNSKSLEFYGLGDGVTLILGIKDKGKK